MSQAPWAHWGRLATARYHDRTRSVARHRVHLQGRAPPWLDPSSSPGPARPIGKLSGAFAGFSAADLGGFAIKGALERAGLSPEQVDYVLMGHVLQAGTGQITARQAAVNAGIGMDVAATTVNKVCLSGLNTIYLADQMVQAGDAEIVVAGGMESMTNAPYLLPGARAGYRLGDKSVVDSMNQDGLFCAFDQVAMGAGTEKYAASADLAREPQDEFAAASHQRAAAAQKNGLFDNEIISVDVPQRKGDPITVTVDEGVRAGHQRRGPRQAAPRVRQVRQHHRRQRQPDLRRRRCRHRDVEGQGRRAGSHPDRRGRGLRPGRRTRRVAPPPAVERHQGCSRPSRQAGERRRPVRAERGVRRCRPRLDGRPGHHRARSPTSTAAPSPSVTRSARPAPAWPSPLPSSCGRRGGGLGAAALCGGGGQGDAILLQVAG